MKSLAGLPRFRFQLGRAGSWRGIGLGLTLLLAGLPLAEARQKHKGSGEKEETPPAPPRDPMEAEYSTPPPAEPVSTPSSSGNTSKSSSSAAAAPAPSAPPPPVEKLGRFMANFKIGPALCLYNCSHQGALLVEIGYSVLPSKNAYLLLPLQAQFAPASAAIIVPLGFQYDLAFPGVSGLYVYPRLSLGYAYLVDRISSGSPSLHAGIAIFEFGLKYVLRGRWNIGGELVSLPIVFGQNSAGAFANIYYRLMLSLGVNF